MWKKYVHVKAINTARFHAFLYRKLTSQQKQELKAIKLRKMLAMARAKALVKAQKAALAVEVLATKPDNQKIETALKNLESAYTAMLNTKADFFLQLRSVFDTAREKRIFTTLWMRKMETKRWFEKAVKNHARMQRTLLRYQWRKFRKKYGKHGKKGKKGKDQKGLKGPKSWGKDKGSWGGDKGWGKGRGSWMDKGGDHKSQGRWGRGSWMDKGGDHKGYGRWGRKGRGDWGHKGSGQWGKGHGSWMDKGGDHKGHGHWGQHRRWGHKGHGHWGQHRRWGHKGHGHWGQHRRWGRKGKGFCPCCPCPRGRGWKGYRKHKMGRRGAFGRKWRAMRKKRQMKRKLMKYARAVKPFRQFHQNLRKEQRRLWYETRYDKIRVSLPLQGRVKLEKATLLSMLMAMDATLEQVSPQIAKLAAAKIAVKRAKIQAGLKFYTNLDSLQKVDYGYLMLRKWKYKKKLRFKAMFAFKKFSRVVWKKSRFYIKRWKQWQLRTFGKPTTEPQDDASKVDGDKAQGDKAQGDTQTDDTPQTQPAPRTQTPPSARKPETRSPAPNPAPAPAPARPAPRQPAPRK